MRVLQEIAPVNLPDAWPLRRIRDIAILINGFPFKSEDFDTSGDIPLVRIRDLFSHQFEIYVPKISVPDEALLRDGDIVIGMDGDFHSTIWNRGPAALNQRICVLRPKKGTDHRFLSYVLPPLLQVLNDLTYSTTVKHLSSQDVLQQVVPFPPIEIQNQVRSFLDRETMQIDELIAKQERLIELLAEKRQAIITQAVTNGLDPSAPTKPSGTVWLGDIPAHWTAGRIKDSVERIEQGVSPQADSTPAPAGSWGVLKSGCVNGGVFRENENKQLPADFIIPLEYVVHLGDLLVSRASGSPKLVGSAARIRSLSSRLILSDKTFRFVTRNHVNTDFLEWFLNSQPYRKQVVANISGAEGLANNISVSALKNIRIALPPQSEQTAIVESVHKQIERLNTLESTASRAIELLKERRSALISAAVTGKIDVREGGV